ncbi:MAG TPA: cytochrome c maturation protein CcmE [Burkholderiaceae bacterium]|nr:cytochrome c maturation protein CcmE [Burkholderiaceae bacterium]
MKPRHKRMALIACGLLSLGLAAYFVLNAFQSNLVFFFTPSQVVAGEAPQNRVFRIGGMVKTGSVKRENLTVNFVVTDTVREVNVNFTGILPDLFREGKGVVAEGKLNAKGSFVASEVLAKHDENYMPPEAKHAVEQAQKTIKTLK